MKKDVAFLRWVADRLVNVYKESPNTDFVQRLRIIAENTPLEQETPLDQETRW